MANLTLAIPDELHTRMKTYTEIRWSEVVRKSITERVDMLETMDKIAKKSKLTTKDVDSIAKKINRATAKKLDLA